MSSSSTRCGAGAAGRLPCRIPTRRRPTPFCRRSATAIQPGVAVQSLKRCPRLPRGRHRCRDCAVGGRHLDYSDVPSPHVGADATDCRYACRCRRTSPRHRRNRRRQRQRLRAPDAPHRQSATSLPPSPAPHRRVSTPAESRYRRTRRWAAPAPHPLHRRSAATHLLHLSQLGTAPRTRTVVQPSPARDADCPASRLPTCNPTAAVHHLRTALSASAGAAPTERPSRPVTTTSAEP